MDGSKKTTADFFSRTHLLPAAFFLGVQILLIFALIRHRETWLWFLWYCNHIALLYAIAFYAKKIQMVKGLMYVGLLAQISWILDFLGHLAGFNFLNGADYIFDGPLNAIEMAAIVVHLVIPLAVVRWSYQVPAKISSLAYALVYILLLYIFSLILSPAEENINCVFKPCPALIPAWHYTAFWPMYVFLLVFITYALDRGISRYLHRTVWLPKRAVSSD